MSFIEAEDQILKNIRLYRKLKDIKAESIAKNLGMSQSEYSKLENGLKRKWTDYLPKIAELFGVSFQELITPNAMVQSKMIQHHMALSEPNQTVYYTLDKELYERFINELKEKERLKDELLKAERDIKEAYKRKYENMKEKLNMIE